jgi:hypothetical protein
LDCLDSRACRSRRPGDPARAIPHAAWEPLLRTLTPGKPPGLAGLATKPPTIGLSHPLNTIGIVELTL